jgi:cytochrome c-type biogenesis protein CcmE
VIVLKASQVKIGLAAVVTVLAIVYLGFTGFQKSMVYYLTVSELKARGSEMYGEGVRVSGHVEPGTIQTDPVTLVHRFVISADGEKLPVVYRGVTPDTFKEGAEVVVEGKYDPSGTFMAETLLAKCPSKYEGVETENDGMKGL